MEIRFRFDDQRSIWPKGLSKSNESFSEDFVEHIIATVRKDGLGLLILF